MDFAKFLDSSATQIDQALEELFSQWRKEIVHLNPHVLKLLDISIEASKGGKRLRGTLVRLGYELAGQEFDPKILMPAASYEIFQTAILAHDDIIDKSALRRGNPTIYAHLGANHYAISQTICLGDIGFFLAFQILARGDFPEKEKIQAIQSFSKTMIDTAFGEILDVELPVLKQPSREEDVLTISRYKTAWYTIVGPMQLGASLGGGDEQLLQNIKTFGENLGIAFQIQDDILGVFGEEKVIGKSVTSDVEEGKLTLLLVYAEQEATPEQKEVLQNYYGKRGLSSAEFEQVKDVLLKTQALAKASQKALEYVDQAKQIIPLLSSDKDYQRMLIQMADFLVKRDK